MLRSLRLKPEHGSNLTSRLSSLWPTHPFDGSPTLRSPETRGLRVVMQGWEDVKDYFLTNIHRVQRSASAWPVVPLANPVFCSLRILFSFGIEVERLNPRAVTF